MLHLDISDNSEVKWFAYFILILKSLLRSRFTFWRFWKTQCESVFLLVWVIVGCFSETHELLLRCDGDLMHWNESMNLAVRTPADVWYCAEYEQRLYWNSEEKHIQMLFMFIIVWFCCVAHIAHFSVFQLFMQFLFSVHKNIYKSNFWIRECNWNAQTLQDLFSELTSDIQFIVSFSVWLKRQKTFCAPLQTVESDLHALYGTISGSVIDVWLLCWLGKRAHQYS